MAATENFRLREWLVEPDLNQISRPGETSSLEPQAMAVLVLLAAEPGSVLSADTLIAAVWGGRPMADNPAAMEELRSILKTREATYALARLTVDTSDRSPEELAALIERRLAAIA